MNIMLWFFKVMKADLCGLLQIQSHILVANFLEALLLSTVFTVEEIFKAQNSLKYENPRLCTLTASFSTKQYSHLYHTKLYKCTVHLILTIRK